MLSKDMEDRLEENEAFLMEPREDYDDCIVGVGYRFNDGPLAVYSMPKVLKVMEDSGMEPEEAEEFFQVNTLGAWVGEGTPIFVEIL